MRQEQLHLEVIVRQDVIEIGDRKRGRLKLITVNDDGSHLDRSLGHAATDQGTHAGQN